MPDNNERDNQPLDAFGPLKDGPEAIRRQIADPAYVRAEGGEG